MILSFTSIDTILTRSNPFDGSALFIAIDSADPGIELGFVNFVATS